MFNDKIATKGDISRNNIELGRQINRQMNDINDQIDRMYNDISYQMEYVQEQTSQKMNELSQSLEEQNKKFEELQKKLNNPLANQANELRSRAIESFNNGWLEEAKEEIKKALELNSKDFLSHLILARIYKKENNINEALKYYDLAIKYSKPYDRDFWKNACREKSELYLEIARNYLKEDNLLESIKYYDLSLNNAFECDIYFYQLISLEKSLIYYKYNDVKKAFEELNNTIKKIRNNDEILPDIYYYLSKFLIKLGKNEEAFDFITLYINKTLIINQILQDPDFKPIKEQVQEYFDKEINPKIEKIKEIETETYEKYKELLEIIKEVDKNDYNKTVNDWNEIVNDWNEMDRKYSLIDKIDKSSRKDLINILNSFEVINNYLDEIKNKVIKFVEIRRPYFSLSLIIQIITNFFLTIPIVVVLAILHLILLLVGHHISNEDAFLTGWLSIILFAFSLFKGIEDLSDDYKKIRVKLGLEFENNKIYSSIIFFVKIILFASISTVVSIILFMYIIFLFDKGIFNPFFAISHYFHDLLLFFRNML